jgi:hypothetical protein
MAEKIVVELEAKIAKTEANLLKIKKEITEIKKEAESTNTEVESLEGASLKGATGLNKIKDSFNKIGIAIKAAGIGLVIAAFAKIKDVLSQNQKFLDAFNVTMEAISIVTNDFVKLVLDNFDDVGKKMKSVFDDPQTSMKSFGQSFKDNVTDKFDSLVGRFTNAGAGFKKLFNRDFEGAMESFGKSFKDVLLSQIPFGESIKENAKAVKDYATEVLETAVNITELAKKSALLEEVNKGLIEFYDVQAEKQRQIRDDETLTFKVRREANEKLGEILTEQGRVMKANAQVAVDLARAKVKQNDNDENQIELQRALNEQAAVTARVTGQMSEQKININSLDKEQLENKKELLKIGKEGRDLAEIESQQTLDAQILLINKTIENEEEKNRLLFEARKAHVDRMKEYDDEQEVIKNEKEIADAEKARQFAAEQIALEENIAQRKREINMQYIGFAAGLSGLLQQIAGKNKAIATAGLILEKGAAIANVVIGASQSIASAKFNESKIPFFIPTPTGIPLFNPLKPASLAATAKSIAMTKIGAGLAIAGIGATAIGQASGVSGGNVDTSKPPIPSVPTAPSTPPAFNIVGQSGTNQLASAIGGQSQIPIQAFVVSGQVTSAQELDRNIIEDASIGG